MEQPSTPSNPSPPSPDDELTRLRAVVADLQTRVAALERGSVSSSTSFVSPLSVPAREATESRFGLTLVNRIGAVTLAIGIIFFFKYAADNQWIGPAARVLLGVVAGLLLIAAAEWLRRRAQEPVSQGLAGCGIAALYISAYAAAAFYNLIPQPVAFLALVLVCAFALVLSLGYANAAIAALAFIGALLTPLLLEGMHAEDWIAFAFVYLGAIELTAVGLASIKGWAILIPLVSLLTILAALKLIDPHHPNTFEILMLTLVALHFRPPLGGKKRAAIASYAYVVGHICLVIGLVRFGITWVDAHTAPLNRETVMSEFVSISLAAYGFVMLAIGIVRSANIASGSRQTLVERASRRTLLDRAIGLVALGLVIGKLYCYDVWLLSRVYRISAFVVLGVLLLAASFLYSRFRPRVLASGPEHPLPNDRS